MAGLSKMGNWIAEKTATKGTGSIVLSGAILGFGKFSNLGDGTVYYTIQDGDNKEIGIGTLAGTTLSRDVVHNTIVNGEYKSDGTKISLSGTAEVYSCVSQDMINIISSALVKLDGVDENATGPQTAAEVSFTKLNTTLSSDNVRDAIEEVQINLQQYINTAGGGSGGATDYGTEHSILQYGAVQNADCTAAFQDAYNAAVADGSKAIHVPAGTWKLDGLQIQDNEIRIRGDGLSTIVIITGSQHGFMCKKDDLSTVRQVTICNMQIFSQYYVDQRDAGNLVLSKLPDPASRDMPDYGIRINRCSYISIYNVFIRGFFINFGNNRSYYTNFQNVWSGSGIYGHLHDGLNNPTVFVNSVTAQNWYGWFLDGRDNGVEEYAGQNEDLGVSRIPYEEWTQLGYDYETNRAGTSGYLLCSGGTIENNGYYAIRIEGYHSNLMFTHMNIEENYHDQQTAQNQGDYDIRIGLQQAPTTVIFDACKFRRLTGYPGYALFRSKASRLRLRDCSFSSWDYICSDDTYDLQIDGHTHQQDPFLGLRPGDPINYAHMSVRSRSMDDKTTIKGVGYSINDTSNFLVFQDYVEADVTERKVFANTSNFRFAQKIRDINNNFATADGMTVIEGTYENRRINGYVEMTDKTGLTGGSYLCLPLPMSLIFQDNNTVAAMGFAHITGIGEPVYAVVRNLFNGIQFRKVSDDSTIYVQDVAAGAKIQFDITVVQPNFQ